MGARAAAGATVAFTLAEAGPVALVVLDVLGREVARLVDAPMPAGAHTVAFEPSGLPAGAYVVRLEAGRTVAARRLTLTR